MARRAGAAAVLFALVCCLLVGPAPARGPVELLPRPLAIVDAVDREASTEPLLPKPLAVVVEAADPSTVLSSVQAQEVEVDPAARQAPQVFRCGGEDAAVSEEPLSLSTSAQPAGKGQVEEGRREQERRDGDSDSDTDGDSDSDDEDEDGIMGWFRRLARLF